ncbi:MAG: hypothetical protein ACLUKN_01440 [Bacilli bacterium]
MTESAKKKSFKCKGLPRIQRLCGSLSVLVNALEYRTGDFLGEWAGLNNALDHRSGQVFTPYYVSKMIAQSSVGNLKGRKFRYQ